MKYFALSAMVGLFFLWTACGDPKPTKADEEQAQAEKNYIPVKGFLRSEINYVDSLPLGISRITRQNGHSDSSYIQAPEFDYLARQFLAPELDTQYFKDNFKETSFFDQSTQSITFTYSAINDTTPLRRVDVILAPKGSTNTIRSIYLERITHKNDTAITRKMFWQARKNFEVVTSRQAPTGQPVVSELHIVWDNSE